MPAPSVTGITTPTTVSTFNSNGQSGFINSTSRSDGSTIIGASYGPSRTFTGNINLSSNLLAVRFFTGETNVQKVTAVFIDSSGREMEFTLIGTSGNFSVASSANQPLLFDLNSGLHSSISPGFDRSAIARLDIRSFPNFSGGSFHEYRLDNLRIISTITCLDGEPGNQGSFQTIFSYLTSVQGSISLASRSGDVYTFFTPRIRIANNSTSTNFFALGQVVIWPSASVGAGTFYYVNSNSLSFEGTSTITLDSCSFFNWNTINLNFVNASGSVFKSSGNIATISPGNLTPATLAGGAGGLLINIAGTYNLSQARFSGNTNNVFIDGVAVTLELSAGQFASYSANPANFPISTINGGSVTVTGPVATTTFSGFPTANNTNGVAPAPVIGFYSSASAAGFIAGLDTSDPEYSSGSFTVLLSDYPGVTHVVGDAVGWIRTDYIPVDADNPPGAVSLAAAFREIVSETGVALVGNGTVGGKAKLTYDQANTRFEVASGPITFADALDKKEELTSNVAGLENFETTTVRGIQFISSKYGNEILLPSPLTIAAAATAATSPILQDFLVVRAGDPTVDPFEHGLASTASGLTDRPEVRMISTLFISGSSGGGATIDAQHVADALKLAPTAGTPAAGSVYAELDSLLAGSSGVLSYDLPQFIALMRADTAFKRALSEGALIGTLADELALVKTQVWTRSDVRTAWNTLITNAGVTDPSVGEISAWNGYTSLLPGLSFAANGVVSYAG